MTRIWTITDTALATIDSELAAHSVPYSSPPACTGALR